MELLTDAFHPKPVSCFHSSASTVLILMLFKKLTLDIIISHTTQVSKYFFLYPPLPLVNVSATQPGGPSQKCNTFTVLPWEYSAKLLILFYY